MPLPRLVQKRRQLPYRLPQPSAERVATSFPMADMPYISVMRTLTVVSLILPVLLLGACSKPDNAIGAGGVTAGEARALDDAAEMLQNQQLPVAAIPGQKTPAAKQAAAKAHPKPAG